MSKVLIIEDDPTLSEDLKDWLESEKHVVEAVHNGKEGLERLLLYSYDLVILDWELPGLNGVEVCRNYRQSGGKTKILMLTGKQEVNDIESGLDAGADDYLTKPFHLKVLSARMRALGRRIGNLAESLLQCGPIVFDNNSRKVTVSGEQLHLMPKELGLLEFLLKHQSEVFTVEALLNRVWSSESDSTVRTVYANLQTLKKKLTACGCPNIIKNVHGLGYRMEAAE
jgi:DNA-binding response OmpR family regulator